MDARAANRALALTWRDDCASDEAFLAGMLDTAGHLEDCNPRSLRAAAEIIRENVDVIASATIERGHVLHAADQLVALADKMHEVE